MQLVEITETQCAHCGADIIAESIRHRHCNGHGFEIREFKCGRKVAFIPNFMQIRVEQECSKAPTETEKRDKRAKALAKALAYIGKLDVDGDWKKEVQSSLDTYRFR
jgi:hypothetical protein